VFIKYCVLFWSLVPWMYMYVLYMYAVWVFRWRFTSKCGRLKKNHNIFKGKKQYVMNTLYIEGWFFRTWITVKVRIYKRKNSKSFDIIFLFFFRSQKKNLVILTFFAWIEKNKRLRIRIEKFKLFEQFLIERWCYS